MWANADFFHVKKFHIALLASVYRLFYYLLMEAFVCVPNIVYN